MPSSTAPWLAIILLLFTIPVLVASLRQFIKRPRWPRAVLLLAMILQSTGLAALTRFIYRETDHAAYLVAFICTSIGPCFLSASLLMGFHHLQSTVPTDRLRLPLVAPTIGLLHAIPVSCFLVGFYCLAIFHQPMENIGPADAFVRLQYEHRAIAYFQLACAGELVCALLLAIALTLVGYYRTGASQTPFLLSSKLLSSTQSMNALMIIGLGWKTFCFLTQGSDSLELLSGEAMLPPAAPSIMFLAVAAIVHTRDACFLEDQTEDMLRLGLPCDEKDLGVC